MGRGEGGGQFCRDSGEGEGQVGTLGGKRGEERRGEERRGEERRGEEGLLEM